MTGNDKCPLKPYKGIKLLNVPKSTLRDWLYKTEYYSRYSELIQYIRTRFTTQELAIIDAERAEGVVAEVLSINRAVWNVLPISRGTTRPRVTPTLIPRKLDKSLILNDDRALEL